MNQIEREYFFAILNKKEAGTATKEELIFLDAYYSAFGVRSGLTQSLQNDELLQTKTELLDAIRYRISDNQTFKKKPVKIKLYKKLVSAAAILIAAGLGLFFYISNGSYNKEKSAFSKSNDIGPGKHTATLTLANGKKIILSGASNGELAKEAGVIISKTDDGQLIYEVRSAATSSSKTYNTLSTAKGETYRVRLPDGSNIWLNSASSLRYPASFEASKRRHVELAGEAYFEISKDRKHPFMVTTHNQDVEVLGTHFNVNAYQEEQNTITTLLEGSVKVIPVKTNASAKSILLKPSEQSVNNQYGIKIKSADIRMVMAWKNGDFVFKDEDFKTIMRKIARWYNVEIFYDASAPDQLRLEGVISRSKPISEVLRIMEATEKVHFKIEGRKITVTK